MLGYLRADNPGVHRSRRPTAGMIRATSSSIDLHGLRHHPSAAPSASAKIAGEMVSLALVEAKMHPPFPTSRHAVVAVPDAKKGEQLVLFTTDATLDRNAVLQKLKAARRQRTDDPAHHHPARDLPVLGSGKTDYVTLNRLAREKVAA